MLYVIYPNPGLADRIRGTPREGMPGRSIRGAAVHGFRAGVFGSAAGPGSDRPDALDRRHISSEAHTRPPSSRMEGSQRAAAQGIVLKDKTPRGSTHAAWR